MSSKLKGIDCRGIVPKAYVSEFASLDVSANAPAPHKEQEGPGKTAEEMSAWHYGNGIHGTKARNISSRHLLQEGMDEINKT